MLPLSFKKYFWDCDFGSLSWEKYKIFITERILNYGNMESVEWVTNLIDKIELLELVKNSRNLDAKTRNYWTLKLDIDD